MRPIPFLVIGLLASGTTTARAQLFNFPTTTMPSGASATTIDAHFGRAMSHASGTQNALGVTVARTGIGGRFSVRAGAGRVDYGPSDREMTFGGAVQARLTEATSPTPLVAFAGVGYVELGGGPITSVTLTRFP